MPIAIDGQVFNDEFELSVSKLRDYVKYEIDPNPVLSKLDPVYPGERYDDSKTTSQQYRDSQYRQSAINPEIAMKPPVFNDNMTEYTPDAPQWNFMTKEGLADSVGTSFPPLRQNISYIDPENRPRLTVTPNSSVSPITEGNIDLYNRPKVETPEGISTVRSLGVSMDGQETLIPTVAHDGSRILSNEEAIQQYKDTGKHLGIFDTQENSDKYAQQLHLDQEAMYSSPFEAAALRLQRSVTHNDRAVITRETLPLATAVTRLGTGLVNLAKFPGKVFKGEIDIQSPEGREAAAKWAPEMALTMVMAPAPLVTKAVDGTLGSIAGVHAKTIDKEKNVFARLMENRGHSTDQIWEATGQFKGADGKWRFELPSQNAKLKIPDPAAPQTLENYLHFPELYEAYPQMKNVKFEIDNTMTSLGSFNAEANSGKGLIKLNLDLNRTMSTNTLDVVLHEVQHKIQQIEKFPLGSNPELAYQKFTKELIETSEKSGKFSDVLEGERLLVRAENVKEKLADKLYWENLGEKEARMVELRRKLDETQRKRMSPQRMQEVKDEAIAHQQELNKLPPDPNSPKGWGSTGE